MTVPTNFPETQELNALAHAASALGYEIVDIAGFLDLVEAQARDQRIALSGVERGAGNIETASAEVQVAAADLGESVARAAEDVDKSAALMRSLGEQSVLVATWVQGLHERSRDISDTLRAVKTNNAHCRNRPILNDRVGLKAGRSNAPFLLQVYRRDMGGGDFRLMKDLSAPILVDGHRWGGLRLAYTF